MPIHARLRNRMDDWTRQGLRRTPAPPAGIDLCSNDYLGLAQHPRIVEAMSQAVKSLGAGSTGSRLLRGQHEVFTQAERKFALWKGTEASLYFSSGYLANAAALTTFAEDGDVLFCDERNHASLIDGARLSRARRVVFPHNDVEALAKLVRAEKGEGQMFIVTESLFSMDGDEAPLEAYAGLCAETGAALIVDEAHAVGIYGARGSGFIEQKGLEPYVFISINTAGKALGVSGAFICGTQEAIEYLVQRARTFVFSTAAPPATAAAILASLEVIAAEPERRQRLFANVSALRELLGVVGQSQIIPVVVGSNENALQAAQQLQAEGFDVRAIRPPTVPAGTARLRISVNQGLTQQEIRRFAAAVNRACAEMFLPLESS